MKAHTLDPGPAFVALQQWFAAVLLAVLCHAAQGVEYEHAVEVFASDAAAENFYGESVAIDGDTAVIGSHVHVHGSLRSGSVYVVSRSASGSWAETAEILPADAADDDFFGISAALESGTLLVGAPDTDDDGTSSGSVYVFESDGSGGWMQQAELHASDAVPHDRFGFDVAISGDTAVVGAIKKHVVSSEAGAVYVFVRSGGTWTEQAMLTAADPGLTAHLGNSVDIDGDTLVAGAHDDGENGFQSGAAYVFVRDQGGIWSQQAKLLAPPGEVTGRDHFGTSVAVAGDTIMVGSRDNSIRASRAGAVYVFDRDANGNWIRQNGQLLASDTGLDDRFGWSLSVTGDRAFIGATGENAVYLFLRDASGAWTEQQKLVPIAGSSGPQFAFKAAAAQDALIVAHRENATKAFRAGSAHIFEVVRPADELIENLIGTVVSLNLHSGIENALDAKLDAALQALDDANTGNDHAATNNLHAFINSVEAQRGNKISDADADTLVAAAQEIIDVLAAS